MFTRAELRKLLDGRRKSRPLHIFDLSSPIAEALGCGKVAVYLSWHTIQKQRKQHAELTIDDYFRIPSVLKGSLVVKDTPYSIILAGQENDHPSRFFRASVKTDWLRDGLFLQSYHILTPKKVQKLRDRHDVLHDPLKQTGG